MNLSLLDCLLMPLFQRLHLLLLLVTPMDRFSDGTTDGAPYVLASVIVAQNITRTYTVRDEAFLVLAFCDVLPQTLHAGAVRRHGALSVFMLTFRRVT